MTADGRIETLFQDPQIGAARLSTDGRHIVFVSTQATREKKFWTFDVTAGRRARLTNTRGEDYSPVVSKDGAQVFFSAWREKAGLYQTSVLGAPERQVSIPPDRAVRGWSLSPDGKWLVVTDDVPGGASDRAAATFFRASQRLRASEPHRRRRRAQRAVPCHSTQARAGDAVRDHCELAG